MNDDCITQDDEGRSNFTNLDTWWEFIQLKRQNAEMTEFIRYLKASSDGYTLWEQILQNLKDKHGSNRECEEKK